MHAKVTLNGALLAEYPSCITVGGYVYFPISSLESVYFKSSAYVSTCFEKGTAKWFNVVVRGKVVENAAWC